jgi:hypothetical protein
MSRKTATLVVAGLVVLVAAIIGIVIAVHVHSDDTENAPSAAVCAQTGTNCPATPTTAVVGIPGSGGLTLGALESQVRSDIPASLDLTGVASVVCTPATTWTAGNTFSCFVYDSSGNGLASMTGTVLETQSGDTSNWNESWSIG